MSEQVKNIENPLGTEKISKLLARFAVPSVVAMLISALYNIVDQIFIGRNVGTLGNAATNVAFPITTICIAISVLCGVGGASRFSIELGRGHKKEASASVGTALVTAASLGVTFALLSLTLTRPMLALFGGSGETLSYAVAYTQVLACGIPFLIISNVMSNFVRADGSPNFSMICMIIGAVINIALDAIMVPYGCQIAGNIGGMRGAALATIISQIISFIIAISYLKRFKSVDFSFKGFKFSFQKAYLVCSLGMSNCVNQLAICAVQIVMNNQLDTYGAMELGKLGEAFASIPQAAFGVVMKVNSMVVSFLVGMAQGSQPLVGYNYGAGKFRRSQKVFYLSATVCLIGTTVGFLLFQFAPEVIISIFGSSENPAIRDEYVRFACKTMRIFLSMIMLNSLQMTISNYFSAIGKPIKGVILSLLRQIIVIIPLLLILPKFFGLDGVLYAAPVTDAISFALAFIFIIIEFRREEYRKK